LAGLSTWRWVEVEVGLAVAEAVAAVLNPPRVMSTAAPRAATERIDLVTRISLQGI
jgi:hypothetical protein